MNVSCFVQFKMLASCIFLLIYVCSLVSYSSCLFSWLCWCVMMWSLKMHDYWLTPTVRQYKYRYNSKLHNSKNATNPFHSQTELSTLFLDDMTCCVVWLCVCVINGTVRGYFLTWKSFLEVCLDSDTVLLPFTIISSYPS